MAQRRSKARREAPPPPARLQLTLEDVKIDADPLALAGMAHELVRNAEFREAFEKNPSQILRGLGFQLPKNVEMVVDPTQLSIALSDIQREDLDEIAAIVAPAVRPLARALTRVFANVRPGARTTPRPEARPAVTINPLSQTRAQTNPGAHVSARPVVTSNPATGTRVTTNPVTRTRASATVAVTSGAAATVGAQVAARTVSLLERVDPSARKAVLAELSRRIEETGGRKTKPRRKARASRK